MNTTNSRVLLLSLFLVFAASSTIFTTHAWKLLQIEPEIPTITPAVLPTVPIAEPGIPEVTPGFPRVPVERIPVIPVNPVGGGVIGQVEASP